MKRKISKKTLILGYIGFFLLIGAVTTAVVLIFDAIQDLSRNTVVFSMLGIIIFLAFFCTLFDFLRRQFYVKEPVDKILEATERIAGGDFTARLEIKHRLKDYDEFDYIMENLNKMAKELSQNEILKNDFVSNVSHEIKTPLAIIQNYATTLKNDNLSAEKRKNYAEILVQASARLNDLVINILKLNKLENQGLTGGYENIRLDEMLAEAVLFFEEAIERKNLRLNCELEEVTVYSSPTNLEIVWNNLISNAVKFTPEGGEIGVYLKKENDCAVVRVSDTGCGISPETGKRIFDKFYQGDTSHAKEGNGLGLALVKKVIDVIGGEISVESEEGKGSTFSITIKNVVNEGKE